MWDERESSKLVDEGQNWSEREQMACVSVEFKSSEQYGDVSDVSDFRDFRDLCDLF